MFTFYIPFCSATDGDGNPRKGSAPAMAESQHTMHRSISHGSGSMSSNGKSEIDSLVEAIREPILRDQGTGDDASPRRRSIEAGPSASARATQAISYSRPSNFYRGESQDGLHQVEGSGIPVRSVKVDPHSLDTTDFRAEASNSNSRGSGGGNGGGGDPMRRKSSAEECKEALQRRDRAEGQNVSDGQFGGDKPPPSAKERRDESAVGSEGVSPTVELPESPVSAAQLDSTKGERRSSSSAQKRRLQSVRAQLKHHGGGSSSSSHGNSSSTSEKLSPLRVLVVEDDPINRMILKKRLGMDGHTVLLAVNGEEGMRQFEKDANEIDCILMDLQMPICNGQDACRRIRSCEASRSQSGEISGRPPTQILNGRVPILAVSAMLTQQMRQEMTEIGMDGWVLKPIDFGRLSALMKGLLHIEDRRNNQWEAGYVWEQGGWLSKPANRPVSNGDAAS